MANRKNRLSRPWVRTTSLAAVAGLLVILSPGSQAPDSRRLDLLDLSNDDPGWYAYSPLSGETFTPGKRPSK